jgi:glucokinase
MKNLGIDIGGSFIKFGIVENDKLIHNVEVQNTANSIFEFQSIIRPIIKNLTNRFHPESIGVGFPGTITNSGIIVSAPNMTYWESENIVNAFSDMTELQTYFQNDAYLAGYAESKLNELSEYYFVTLGTGIGSVLIRDKAIVTTSNGSSGELGHIIINFNENGDDYRTGIFERYFNANEFVERAKADLKNFPNSMLNSLDSFSVREISDAVNIGDDLAIINFMEMGKILGIGFSSVANLTGIPIFVIGGGISQVNNLLFETAISEMKKRVIPELKENILIIKSKLQNEAGILGAALFAKEKIK